MTQQEMNFDSLIPKTVQLFLYTNQSPLLLKNGNTAQIYAWNNLLPFLKTLSNCFRTGRFMWKGVKVFVLVGNKWFAIKVFNVIRQLSLAQWHGYLIKITRFRSTQIIQLWSLYLISAKAIFIVTYFYS